MPSGCPGSPGTSSDGWNMMKSGHFNLVEVPPALFFLRVSFAPKIDCKIAGGRIGTSTSSSIFVRPSVGINIDSGSHLHSPGVPLFALQACGTHAMSKRCKPCPAPPALCCLLG